MLKFPINVPNISPLEKKYVEDVLDSNWLSAAGKYTEKFEKLVEIIVKADYENIKKGNVFDFTQVKLMPQFKE